MQDISFRKLLISKNIDNDSASDVIKEIFNINHDDDTKELKYKDFKREPIQLYINSFGGSVYDGLAIVDAIRQSKTPIHTYCLGSAMSMAFIIYLSAKRRFAGENCTFMYHELSSVALGKLQGIKDDVKEFERLQVVLDNIVKENTNIMQDMLDNYRSKKSEWYISSQDAIKLGISHEVI